MTITALPTAPDPATDTPAQFSTKAAAWVAAMATFTTEANALAAAMNLNSTTDTSASSVAIGTGAKTFTVSTGKSFQPGMYLVIADTAAPSTNSMFGQVTSYSTDQLVMNIISVLGSGTKTAWTISQSAAGGASLGANLFNGLQSEAEGAAVASAGTIDIWATDGNTRHITGSTGPITSMGTAPQAGAWMKLIFDSTPTLTQGTNLNLNGGGSDIAIEAGDVAFVYADTTTQLDVFVIRKSGSSVVAAAITPSVRQCVLEGPVTSAGLPNYGASTGSSTVTVSGTLKATAAYGELDRTGSITNPSWTGLESAGARYFLYLTVNADGTCTTGSSLNLQPTVQWGGTYGTSNGQHTFNIQEMTGKVGNGVTADQAYRVYVGEVTVSGANVVDAIYWYQLKRRYQATSTSVPSTTRITMQHHLGFIPDEWGVKLVCNSMDLGYGVGEEVEAHGIMDSGTNPITNSSVADRFDMGIIANSNTLYLYHKTTGTLTAITAANWDTKFYAKGSW